MSQPAALSDRAPLAAVRRSMPPRGALVLLLAGQLVTGVVIGLIWLGWAPRAVSYFVSDGNGGSLVIPEESEAQVAGDGRFVLLTVLAGLAFGLIAWQLRRQRGRLTMVVLGLGALLSSLLARFTGQLLSGGSKTAPINTAFHPPLALHASAAIWLQPLLAVLVYTVLVGLASDPALGRAGVPAPAGPPSDLAAEHDPVARATGPVD